LGSQRFHPTLLQIQGNRIISQLKNRFPKQRDHKQLLMGFSSLDISS